MSWVAAGVTGGAVAVGGITSYLGASKAADAAQQAAQAQAEQAAANRAAIMGIAGKTADAATKLANSTPQELNILGQSYEAASTNLSQQQKLMASIDPALMEASKQALDIMRGGNAAANGPMMQMRQQQRAQLVNSLRAQFGPGAENTSIGQKQLQQFDMESQSSFQQNQQNSLGQLMGIATSGGNGANVNNAIGGLETVGQGYSALQNRQLSTAMNLGEMQISGIAGTNVGMLQTAGAGSVAAGLQGQGMASIGNSIANTGGMLGSAYLMRGQGGMPAPGTRMPGGGVSTGTGTWTSGANSTGVPNVSNPN